MIAFIRNCRSKLIAGDVSQPAATACHQNRSSSFRRYIA